jgi:hypothetical protein
MLTETRGSAFACVEMADVKCVSSSNKGTAYMPFPILGELLQYRIFKDLIETDRSLEATKAKFRGSSDLVDKAILDWRFRLEAHFISLVDYGRNIRKRECLAGNELILGMWLDSGPNAFPADIGSQSQNSFLPSLLPRRMLSSPPTIAYSFGRTVSSHITGIHWNWHSIPESLRSTWIKNSKDRGQIRAINQC